MTPPFARRTRPAAVLYSTRTDQGDVISLRVPGVSDPADCRETDDAAGEELLAAFADQLPCWWVEYAACPGGGNTACACGMTELASVIGMLPGPDQREALAAHLAQTQSLRDHLEAAWDMMAGEMGDVCVRCVTDTTEHAVDLDGVLDQFCRDLVEACAASGTALQLGA